MKKIAKPAVFLDRDGTINYDDGYTHKFSNFKFKPHVINGLKFLCKKKYLVFIVTNQAGIAKGKFKLKDLHKLHKSMIKYLKKKGIYITDIEFCPYHPNALIKKYKKKTNYRKPGNLMLKKLIKKWNVDKENSFMLGDRISDKIAAKKTSLYFEYPKYDFCQQVKKIHKKIINNY